MPIAASWCAISARSKDGRLLFGGREAYTADSPRDISDAYPPPDRRDLSGTGQISRSTHAWGGSVGITLPRQPFVREVMPGVTSIGGYSGHGVMLSNYCGKLYADLVTGGSAELDLYQDLEYPGLSRRRTVAQAAAVSGA